MALPTTNFHEALLLIQLAGREGGVSFRELEENHGITRKKVLWYAEALPKVGIPPYSPGDIIDFWIYGDRVSVYSTLPLNHPLNLNETDILALTLALDWASTVGLVPQETAGRLREKIIRCRPREDDFFEIDEFRIHFADEFDGMRWIRPLTEMINSSHQATLVYYSKHKGSIGERLVVPYRLYFRAGVWYLRAYQFDEQTEESGWRTFRLDRIRQLEDTGIVCDRTTLPALEAGEELFVFTDGNKSLTRTRFLPSSARYVREMSLTDCVEDLPDGGLILGYEVVGFPYYKSFVLQFGPDAEVLEPEHYRAALVDQLQNLLDHLERDG